MRLDSRPPRRTSPRRRRTERPMRYGLYGENMLGPVGWLAIGIIVFSLVGAAIIELGGWNV